MGKPKELMRLCAGLSMTHLSWLHGERTRMQQGKCACWLTPMELSPKLWIWLDLSAVLGSVRCKRFSMVVEDGVVKVLNVEPDGTGLTCSLAPAVADQL